MFSFQEEKFVTYMESGGYQGYFQDNAKQMLEKTVLGGDVQEYKVFTKQDFVHCLFQSKWKS